MTFAITLSLFLWGYALGSRTNGIGDSLVGSAITVPLVGTVGLPTAGRPAALQARCSSRYDSSALSDIWAQTGGSRGSGPLRRRLAGLMAVVSVATMYVYHRCSTSCPWAQRRGRPREDAKDAYKNS